MDRAKVLRLIQSVADDPPSEIRRVKRKVGPYTSRRVLPLPEAAELRMRNIRQRLDIVTEQRSTLCVDKNSHPKRFTLGDT